MPSAKSAKAKFPGRSMAQNGRFKPRKSNKGKVSKSANLAANKKIQAGSKIRPLKEDSDTVLDFDLHLLLSHDISTSFFDRFSKSWRKNQNKNNNIKNHFDFPNFSDIE